MTLPSRSADLVVVGAGILGLAVAREALDRYPGIRVAVLEKEWHVATHQTGHNSGVVHAGIYYAPGSLKAALCVAGNKAMYAYCDEHGIPYEQCGKVVVASDEDQIPLLDDLFARASQNGVPSLTLLDEGQLHEAEPEVRGLRGLHSQSSGIVDFRRVATTIADEIRAKGALIETRAEVRAILHSKGGVARLTTSAGTWDARAVITCAGLQSDRLARMTGAPAAPQIVPFRGRYYSLASEAATLVHGLVYPVPDPSFPFLGVHFTKQISGGMWVGPNAVLAFAREGYRARDLDLADLREIVAYPGFRLFARRHWRTALGELRGDISKRAFVAALQKLVPAIRVGHLAKARTGVRAQALGLDGGLVDDFWFDRADNVVHVRNAPSPGATSSFAIASHVLDAAAEVVASG